MSDEIHTVQRAIIMAAGVGNRMHPLTYTVPKPLIEVNGKRMIDTVIDGLHQNGIMEIYVVVGYLKEKFFEWGIQKNVQFIENPFFDSCNNISSLYAAREHLGDCIILDADQIIYNPKILDPRFSLSGYNAVWCEGETDEWLMNVENGIVKSCSRTGGSHGWQLYSISRWSKEDGIRLKKNLEYEFERGNKDIYWDDVVMFCHFDEYKLGIYEMQKSDITEIDNLHELASLDNRYQYLIDAEAQKR